jgi:uncharacterized protein (TIGR03435 family)
MVAIAIAITWLQGALASSAGFEVASIKPGKPGARGYSFQPLPERLVAENVTLKMLIAQAYHVYEPQVSGPKWIDVDRYDLEAKVGADSNGSKD